MVGLKSLKPLPEGSSRHGVSGGYQVTCRDMRSARHYQSKDFQGLGRIYSSCASDQVTTDASCRPDPRGSALKTSRRELGGGGNSPGSPCVSAWETPAGSIRRCLCNNKDEIINIITPVLLRFHGDLSKPSPVSAGQDLKHQTSRSRTHLV